MREDIANIWEYDGSFYRAITTNGTIKKDGSAVMGRGVAKEAADRFPTLPKLLGELLKDWGNKVFKLPYGLISFPVKHNWWEQADLDLIKKSAYELDALIQREDIKVVLPRPGCGNGSREWSEVKPIIEGILDDRVVVIDKPTLVVVQ